MKPALLPTIRGRGAQANPSNRFERLHIQPGPSELAEEWELEEPGRPTTQFFRDHSRSILASNTSPDIPYRHSINAYRGCEHGCIYCYARPTHEYLGFSAGLEFETKIMVKDAAPALLRRELSKKGWTPQPIAMSGVTDIYQPAERHFRLTRQLLEVLLDFRNPVTLITKNALILRDLDLLSELARLRLVSVALSVTTLREDLRRTMEPRTSTAARRLDAVAKLSAAGVPVGVMMGPVIPGLTDEELPAVVKAAAAAGALWAGYNVVHFPHGTAELFLDWLERCYPQARRRVEGRIREVRGGELNDPRFGSRMTGTGPYAQSIAALYRVACLRAGLPRARERLDVTGFRVPGLRLLSAQPGLFDDATDQR
ncbi:PA0069 family radical SAM protein [Deinococcus sp.]|uniref:PA0069 family radical SAM protein n=1 Tax=Deinococcus sp. TaxID=47478 RepID=UPI003CC6D183